MITLSLHWEEITQEFISTCYFCVIFSGRKRQYWLE
jgi:hypothetical protein